MLDVQGIHCSQGLSATQSTATPSLANTKECASKEPASVQREWASTAKVNFATLAVHAGVKPDAQTGAILTPIYSSTTFVQPDIEQYLALGFSYSRSGNPTVRALEQKIAALEKGYDAACFGTGMAATTTMLSALLQAGDHIVCTNCSYGGTNRALRVHFIKFNIETTFVDFKNIKEIEAAIRPNTKLLFSETPTNPILDLADVKAISDLAHSRGLIHACDSTFATPLIMRPIDLGADVVVQSTTKFYDGHNISTGGAIISANAELHEKITFTRNVVGSIMTPEVAFSTLQTIKTLHLRVVRQSETAQKIAEFLSKHRNVASVKYPGLENFPQRQLACRQHMNGLHGGMLCFEVRGGTEAGMHLMNTIKRPWSLCENLGATESIVTCPSVFTHANMLREDRLKVGITDGLVRVSCGVECAEDLMAALGEALDAIPESILV